MEAVCNSIALSLGYSSLKDKQKKVIVSFAPGNNVFTILPTSYEKSLVSVYLVSTLKYCCHNLHNKSPFSGLRNQKIDF